MSFVSPFGPVAEQRVKPDSQRQGLWDQILQRYNRVSEGPGRLTEVPQKERPGIDTQSFFEQLNTMKNIDKSRTLTVAQQMANQRAQQQIEEARSMAASMNQDFDFSGIVPRYTGGGFEHQIGNSAVAGYPLRGNRNVTAGYGQSGSRWRNRHTGIDFAAPAGTPIYATHNGTVSFAGNSGAYGNMTHIDGGGGMQTRYAHQSRIAVRPGDQIRKGQIIGYVGSTGNSTGNHLHYEILVNGRHVNPKGYL